MKADAPPVVEQGKKRPAYQWYPGDFKRDTALQACSFEARSLWREMLDLMHDGEPYGHLTAGGIAILDAQLARMVGIPLRRAVAWLFELESRGVFSRTSKGVIYSRRMVKDERIRNVRAAGGPKALNHPDVPKPKDKGKDGGKDTFDQSLGGSPAVAVAVATAKTTTRASRKQQVQDGDPLFDAAWDAYPKRPNNSRAAARRAWDARKAEGADPEKMLAGVRQYAVLVKAQGTEGQFVKLASTFFGPDRHFDNDMTPAPVADATSDRIVKLLEEEDAALARTRALLAKRGAA